MVEHHLHWEQDTCTSHWLAVPHFVSSGHVDTAALFEAEWCNQLHQRHIIDSVTGYPNEACRINEASSDVVCAFYDPFYDYLNDLACLRPTWAEVRAAQR
jgi:hypothetical protein